MTTEREIISIQEGSRYFGDPDILGWDAERGVLLVTPNFHHDHVWQRDGKQEDCDFCNAEVVID